MKKLSLYAPEGIPLIQHGDDIGTIICEAVEKEGVPLEDGDIAVVASKIVSKAEGRLVDIQEATPSSEATALAEQLQMDPRNVEVILRETKRVLIVRPGFLLTENLLGLICTSAGVDSSNTVPGPKGRVVSLLPEDPDASAERIRRVIESKTGRKVAVVINDTFGRSDREGSVGMAIGISGIAAVYHPAVREDIHGKKRSPEIAQVDELAAAASLLMGQTNERRPVVIVCGVPYEASEGSRLKDLLHPVTKYFEDARDALAHAHQQEGEG